jgi:hypothetical protein
MISDFAATHIEIGGLAGTLVLFFAMVIGHALGDYPLQGSFLATGKNRHVTSATFFGGGEISPFLWVHSLTAHSLIQAGMVWIVTGSGALALAEFILHWIIDFVRCEKWIGFSLDQALHLSCKLIYAIVLVTGFALPF